MGIIQAGTYELLRLNGSELHPNRKEPDLKDIFIFLEDLESGDTITDYLYTSNAAWDQVTAPRLKAYGWDPEANSYAISQLNLTAEEGNPLAGKFVGPVVIKDEEFKGKTRQKVTQVGEFVREQMSHEEAKLFEAHLRARLTGGRTTTPKAAKPNPAPPPAQVAAGGYDDDVGF